MRNAWCTCLLSQDYLEAVLVLNRSIKETKSIYPFICMCPRDVLTKEIKDIFQKEEIRIRIIQRISCSEQAKQNLIKNNLQKNIYNDSKINVFNLKEYDKICFLDADGIILKNIDDVFLKYKDGSSICYNNREAIFCFSIICPKNHQFYIHKILSEYLVWPWDYVFSDIFFHIKDNIEYKIEKEYFEVYSSQNFYLYQSKGIHFIAVKPWKIEESILINTNELILKKYWILLKNIREMYNTFNYTFKGENNESYQSRNYSR